MKNLAAILAFVVFFSVETECEAQRPNRDNVNQDKKGQRAKGARQTRGQQRPIQNTDEMVARMLQEFDKNGDKELNVKELIAWYSSVQKRRLAQRNPEGPRRGEGRPGEDARPNRGKGKRGGKKGGKGREGDKAEDFNGVKPKRPGGN